MFSPLTDKEQILPLCTVAREGDHNDIVSACGGELLKALPYGRYCCLRICQQRRLATERVGEKAMKRSRIPARAGQPIDVP
jgi:hypothetical protein